MTCYKLSIAFKNLYLCSLKQQNEKYKNLKRSCELL